MSRLTRRIIDICGSCDQQEYCRYTPNAGNCYLRQLHEKLKRYEDLEEQGRLIELPCAVGDKVWRITTQQDSYDNHEYKVIIQSSFRLDFLGAMGDRIFTTKAEAEAKLKELKGE